MYLSLYQVYWGMNIIVWSYYTCIVNGKYFLCHGWKNGRLEFDDELDPFAGKTEEEVREIQAEKEAKANAQILEMVSHSQLQINSVST